MFTNSYRHTPTVDVEALGKYTLLPDFPAFWLFVHEVVHLDLTYTCPVFNALSWKWATRFDF